jgi:hypothetical protein
MTTNRPADIQLPKGWTWERVEQERTKWDISDNMVPVALAPGCVAWGTINSVRTHRDLEPAVHIGA